MWSSKKAVFRHGRLERIYRDLYEPSLIVRFRVDGEFFFTDLLQFEAPDELDAHLKNLATDKEAFLGAHRLDDGSFWLHWLKVPGEMELVPKPTAETTPAAREKAATWGVIGVLLLIVAFAVILGGRTTGAAMLGVLLLLGGGLCCMNAWEGVAVLLNSATAIDRIMQQGLERLHVALAEGRTWEMPGLGPSTASAPPPVPDLPTGLRLCRVERAHAYQETIRPPTARGSVSIDFVIYDFVCGEESVSWPVRDESHAALHMSAFRHRHPPFLARGDQVIVYSAASPDGLAGLFNKLGMPSLEFTPVLELFNLTDRTAYWSETDHRGSLPSLYVGLGLLLAIMILLCGIVAVLQTSEPWFLPAILDILEFVAFSLPCGILTMGVVLLLMELFIAAGDGDPEIAAGRKRWRETVATLNGPSAVLGQGSPFWARLFKWRIGILLGLMILSILCLSVWFF